MPLPHLLPTLALSLSRTSAHTLTDRHVSSTCTLLNDGCCGLSLMLALSDGPHGGCCWTSSACCMFDFTLCLSGRCLNVHWLMITGLTNAQNHYITNCWVWLQVKGLILHSRIRTKYSSSLPNPCVALTNPTNANRFFFCLTLASLWWCIPLTLQLSSQGNMFSVKPLFSLLIVFLTHIERWPRLWTREMEKSLFTECFGKASGKVWVASFAHLLTQRWN